MARQSAKSAADTTRGNPETEKTAKAAKSAKTAQAGNAADSAEGKPQRVIKKYPNRRLYDTTTSSYITLTEIKHLVMDGQTFAVRDAKTGDDLTRSILLQIILEEESAGAPMFTEAVLANREQVTVEDVSEKTADYDDGLDAKLIRAGANMSITGQDPKESGGQYYLIVNGSLIHQDQHLAKWSVMFVHATDPALSAKSGPEGCELLMLQFGKQ